MLLDLCGGRKDEAGQHVLPMSSKNVSALETWSFYVIYNRAQHVNLIGRPHLNLFWTLEEKVNRIP